MSSAGSITRWFDEIQRGDSAAVGKLWERYFPALIQLARDKLRGSTSCASDEEDVALSAMASFFDAARQGRFPNLADRHDLWRLLFQITLRKALDLRRHEMRQRRGGGHVRNESTLAGQQTGSDEWSLAQVIGKAPDPEFAASVAEEYRLLLGLLAEPDLQALAVAKMEGYTNQEIADRADCSVRTVERRLQLIRKIWSKRVDHDCK